MRVFHDILVMPTQGMRNGVGRPEHQGMSGFVRGGPVWPFFPFQVAARHCRGFLPIPCDHKPVRAGDGTRTVRDGVWCGPVSPHFGHMICDFGSRIARSIHETDVPLVFSLGPDVAFAPRPFFRQILDCLGASGREVVLVTEPTRFGRLRVFRQEERVGARPEPRYLDLLDRLARRRPARIGSIDRLFVSRALVADGKFAGEAYLDRVLSRLGVVVIHPETMSLEDQLDHYRRARTIIASEGSALHGMQLLGRLDADLVVLVRRRGWTLARRALAARARSLRYWDCADGLIHGCHVHGRPQLDRALVLIDPKALTDRLRTIGLDVAPLWEAAAFAEIAHADILRFAWYNRAVDLHPSAMRMIQGCLDTNGIDIDLEAALPAAGA